MSDARFTDVRPLKSLQRVDSAMGIVLIGCLAIFGHLYHLYIEQGLHSKLLGIVFPLILSILLVIAGIWLHLSQLNSAYTSRVTAWTAIGLLGGVAFGYPVVPYQAAHGVTMADVPFLAVNWGTTGALGGFLIGSFNARQRQYQAALEDERARLDARKQELERQNERLERFASVISHDLRNPLNVATGRLALAQQDCDSDNLESAETALNRMETLIEDLLSLARQGQPIDDTVRISLATIADRAWASVNTKEATFRLEDDLTIGADPDRLQQLFENLFRNAIDHASESVTVHVGALPDKSGFYIADDGLGIPEDERDEVFTFGYSSTKEGTGLGLAIVAEIVEAHGWEIHVTDSGESGARFEITGVEVDAE